MDYKGGEVLVDAVVAKIQAGLEDRLTRIGAQYNDGIDLEVVPNDRYYVAGQESFLAPSIFVIEGTSVTDPATEGPHSLVTSTQIAVYVAAQDYDRQKLGKKLKRYARAITECVWDNAPREELTGVAPYAGRRVAHHIAPIGTRPGRAFDPEASDEFGAFYIVMFAALASEADDA